MQPRGPAKKAGIAIDGISRAPSGTLDFSQRSGLKAVASGPHTSTFLFISRIGTYTRVFLGTLNGKVGMLCKAHAFALYTQYGVLFFAHFVDIWFG